MTVAVYEKRETVARFLNITGNSCGLWEQYFPPFISAEARLENYPVSPYKFNNGIGECPWFRKNER